MAECSIYVGLDVHKDTISVAIAGRGHGEPIFRGPIRNDRALRRRLVRQLSPNGERPSFCYEAGPCGYGLCRELTALGHDRIVVAPSLIPRCPGDRVKTDRRDALLLARLHRSGEPTLVWVPDAEQEAIRDLVRVREDLKAVELRMCQRLSAFLLRHERVYRSGRSRWTQAHARWLEAQAFDHPAQQIVFQERVDAVQNAGHRGDDRAPGCGRNDGGDGPGRAR